MTGGAGVRWTPLRSRSTDRAGRRDRFSVINLKDYGVMKKKLTVYGLVQGVGFRPFVAELCEKLKITGTVRNSGGIVIIEASGEDSSLVLLREKLESLGGKNSELPGARVDLIEEEVLDESSLGGAMGSADDRPDLGGMRILSSDEFTEEVRFLPPDIATCPRCEKELLDPANRRYRYPFISCFSCGPRYTIMDAVPYDREHTTMKAFPLCGDCQSDFEEFGNVRHYAQTIACADCGPRLIAYERDQFPETVHGETSAGKTLDCNVKSSGEGDAAFARAVEVLKTGGVVAVKDIGGYHLAFDPYNEKTAQRLRAFKHRERKPFAVMFSDVDSIREMCEVSGKEEEFLLSDARPIVLLRRRPILASDTREFAPGVCGASDNIGAMLPCNPLQILLMKECGPLVMTSANRGGEPMIIDDEKMREFLKPTEVVLSEGSRGMIAGVDLVLANDREILTGLDDSVCQVFRDKVQFIRRARGYVPTPVIMKKELPAETFAAGGDLKSVFAFGKKRFAYLSGHYGDLEEYSAYLAMQDGVKHFKDLFGFREQRVVCDLHPAYVSSKYGKDVSEGLDFDAYMVQHHHAHVASVIAEHGVEGKVLGVAFDGTGYGTDGTIWGGEFLLCDTENGAFERIAHLKSVEMTGGDQMAKNADIPATCYLYDAGVKTEDSIILASLENHINTVKNSSAGRLFDAVAAVLDLCHENSYEGECPNVLQRAAERYAESHLSPTISLRLNTYETDGQIILDTSKLVADIAVAVQSTQSDTAVSVEQLAYEFHVALAEAVATTVESLCEKHGVTQVAFSGGTFYNRLLLEEVFNRLEKPDLKLYINEQVPGGDGGLALGQLFLTL